MILPVFTQFNNELNVEIFRQIAKILDILLFITNFSFEFLCVKC